MIEAHKFLNNPDVCTTTTLQTTAVAGQEYNDEPSSGRTEVPSDELVYPSVIDQPDDHIEQLLASARQRLEVYFERQGNMLQFLDKDITQTDMLKTLNDLELLVVYVTGQQNNATTELENHVAGSITDLAQVFLAMPQSLTVPSGNQDDLHGVQESLNAVASSTEHLKLYNHAGTVERDSFAETSVH